MNIFAFVMLITILIVTLKILNWIYRLTWDNEENLLINIFITLLITVISLSILIPCFKYIILWGYPLITK